MGLLEKVVEGVFAIFIIVLFATAVFPALGEATGQNLWWVTVILAFLIIAIIYKIIESIFG